MDSSDTKNIRHLVQSYGPLDFREKVYKEQMLGFIEHSQNHFDRANKLGHFTASALVTNNDLSKYLLMHHKKLNRWLQLGGHCDGDNDVVKVALKESEEESGIDGFKLYSKKIFDLDIHFIPANKVEVAHYHFDCRFLLIARDTMVKKNKESNKLEWFDLKDSIYPTDNLSIIRMLDKLQKLKEA